MQEETTKAVTPLINPVPNPVDIKLDRSELEFLAVHHFTQTIYYDYEQFAYPGEPIPTQDWIDDQIAMQRLKQITEILGEEKMTQMQNVAAADFRLRNNITPKNWAEFTGTPVSKGDEFLDRVVDVAKENL